MLPAMEWGHKRRRGFFASWPHVGVAIGLLLGNGAVILFANTVGNFDSASFGAGWRWPFWFSLVLVAVGLFVRLKVLETPLFSRILEERRVEREPVVEVVKTQPKEIRLSALIRCSEQAPFYSFTAFVLADGVNDLTWTRTSCSTRSWPGRRCRCSTSRSADRTDADLTVEARERRTGPRMEPARARRPVAR